MSNQPLKIVYGQLELSLTQRIRIGRANQLELMIAGDPLVSSHHCMIEQSINQSINQSIPLYQLIDHQSTNGTLINGIRIPYHKPRSLMIGDVITVGETQIYVKEGKPYDQSANQSINQPINQSISQSNDSSNRLSPKLIKKSWSLNKTNRTSRPIPSINLSSINHPIKQSNNQSLSPNNQSINQPLNQSNDKPPPTRLSSPTHPRRSVSGNDRPYLSSDRPVNQSINQSISAFYPDHFSVDESFDSFDSVTDQIVDETFNPPTDDENLTHDQQISYSDNQSISQSTDQSSEVSRLRDALRASTVKQNRLEKKLADARRKQTINQSINHSMSQTTQKLQAYESMIDALKYQLLYGDSAKDQQIDHLIARLNQLSVSQSENQSINQSMNRSVHQSLDDSFDHSNSLDVTQEAHNESINQSVNQSIYLALAETRNQLLNTVKICEIQSETINQLINQSFDQSIDQIEYHSKIQTHNDSINQSINQSIDHINKRLESCENVLSPNQLNTLQASSINQSMNQSVNQTITHANNTDIKSVSQPINQSIKQLSESISPVIHPSIDAKFDSIQTSIQQMWLMSQYTIESVNQSINRSINQSVNQSIFRQFTQPTVIQLIAYQSSHCALFNQSIHPTSLLLDRQSINQSINQSTITNQLIINQPTSQSVNQSMHVSFFCDSVSHMCSLCFLNYTVVALIAVSGALAALR